MSAAQTAVPASSHLTASWHSIDWETSYRQVRGLQVRIAKAAKNQQWRRVKALQRMLVRSFAAKALAVKRVTENRGRRTPGVDGETWSTPEGKWGAIFRLKRTGYQPRPLRRVYIPKANGQRRPLGIPTGWIGLCRPYTCWHSNRYLKPQPIETPMVFVLTDLRQTQSSNCSSISVANTLRSG